MSNFLSRLGAMAVVASSIAPSAACTDYDTPSSKVIVVSADASTADGSLSEVSADIHSQIDASGQPDAADTTEDNAEGSVSPKCGPLKIENTCITVNEDDGKMGVYTEVTFPKGLDPDAMITITRSGLVNVQWDDYSFVDTQEGVTPPVCDGRVPAKIAVNASNSSLIFPAQIKISAVADKGCEASDGEEFNITTKYPSNIEKGKGTIENPNTISYCDGKMSLDTEKIVAQCIGE